MEFSAFIKALRQAKRLTQRDVETLSGNAISNAYLSQLESGKIKTPSLDTCHHLAKVYGLDPLGLVDIYFQGHTRTRKENP